MFTALTKSQSVALQSGTLAFLSEIGAVPDDDSRIYEYRLETPFGAWRVHVFDDWIATRFDEPARAHARVACNPCSGKWNFYCTNADVDGFLCNFERTVRRLLATPEGA